MGLRENFAEQRFQALVLAWLSNLPPEGWRGTSKQLSVALASASTTRQYVPRAGSLAVLGIISTVNAAGWDVAERRTSSARLIVFSRREGKP